MPRVHAAGSFAPSWILHDKVREVFESRLRLARHPLGLPENTGYAGGVGTRPGFPGPGRGEGLPPSLLADAIVNLLRSPMVRRCPAIERRGLRRRFSPIPPDAPDWSRHQGLQRPSTVVPTGRRRKALLAEIPSGRRSPSHWKDRRHPARRIVPRTTPTGLEIVAAAELLGQLLLQYRPADQ